MGLTYLKMGKKGKAIKARKKALQLDPDFEPAKNKLLNHQR